MAKKISVERVLAAASEICGKPPRTVTPQDFKKILAAAAKCNISRERVNQHLRNAGYTRPPSVRKHPEACKLIAKAFKAVQSVQNPAEANDLKSKLLANIAEALKPDGIEPPTWDHVTDIARNDNLPRWPNFGGIPRLAGPVQKMREFAAIYNNFKMCPLNHDLFRVLFPGSQVNDPQRLLRREVERYRKFRAAHKDDHLPELILRTNKDGRMIAVPEGVLAQLDEYRIDTKKVQRAKGVIVTSAQFGGTLNTDFWQALKRYADHRGYALAVLPIKYGPVMTVYQKELAQRVLTSTFDEALKGHMLFEDLKLANGSLTLNVIRLRPTLVRFLTDPICERGGNASQIFAAPKLELEHRPRFQHDYPKAIMTTGAVTHPSYNVDNLGQQDRTGELAAAEHTYAAVIVEFSSKKTFHYRQLLANTKGEFYDIDPINGGAVYVTPKGITYAPDGVDTAVLGDWHVGKTHPDVREITFGPMLQKLNPKHVILHDLFDGNSISHWDDRQASRRTFKATHQQDSVKNELDALVKELEWMRDRLPGAKLHVVASNHNDFLMKYIESKDWFKDPVNIAICSEIFAALQKDLEARGPELFEVAPMDPVNWWLQQHAPFAVTHGRRSDMLLPESPDSKKIAVTLHGDIGPGGGKASSMGVFRKWNQWSIIGHMHAAAIHGPVWRVGTSTHLTEHYINGPRTNWTHTHALIYANGQRQLLNIVNGAFHGQLKMRPKSAGINAPSDRPKKSRKKSASKR